jgi:hypothetical protein
MVLQLKKFLLILECALPVTHTLVILDSFKCSVYATNANGRMKKISTMKRCCEKNGNIEGVCQKAGNDSREDQRKGNCDKPESTCICICCFQYTAPDQTIINFSNDDFSVSNNYNLPREQHWLDPYISAPWQPPDLALSI